MNTPHPPGPWYVEHIGSRPYIVDQPTKNFGIAEVHGITPETAEANARLLAAAPELLQSLQSLLWQWDNHQALMGMALQDARAAILKATTQQ
jgi:hypothetical protein